MSGGWKSLADMHKARTAERSAKHLRATARMYDPMSETSQTTREAAKKAELDAYYYRRRALDKD